MPTLDLSKYSDAPVYNTKAVVQKTGIPAATLRAWERRYGVPNPDRTESNYRLYSERDIALIRWLRERVDEGITMSQAVDLYKRIKAGQDVPSSLVEGDVTPAHRPLSFPKIQQRLIESFQSFDEKEAEMTLSEAFAAHSLDNVCTKVIQPTMKTIGQMWHDGDISVPVEHFASSFMERKLMNLITAQPLVPDAPLIVTGCATHEQHHLGILLISLFLRRAGYRVVYLGPNVPLRELENILKHHNPVMVALSAATSTALPSLREFGELIGKQDSHLLYLVGGFLFQEDPDIIHNIPNARFLDETDDIEESVRQIAPLIRQHQAA